MDEFVARRAAMRLTLMAIVAINLVTVSTRFLNGLPQGVDSTSHLFRVMLMSKSYQEDGYVPQWNPDWYGGTMLFVLYPPLSYYLTFALSQAGLGPILAYKVVDSTFYLLGPVAVYYLARNMRVDKTASILAALLFSFSPTIIENYLFYDRFPNIISLPLVCLFVVTLSRALTEKRGWLFLIVSGILFGSVILIHHLSALCAALLGLLLAFATSLTHKRVYDATRPFAILAVALSIGLLLSSFWFFPFITSLNQFLDNPFYNRNVEFPFIRLSYFSLNVATYAFGIAHLSLSLFALSMDSHESRPGKRQVLIPIAAMLAGMALFESGEKIAIEPAKFLGQGIVVLSLFGLVYSVLQSSRKAKDQNLRTCFLKMSFVIFFWLSLGVFALPFFDLPPLSWLWRALDVHRFWLYLAIPMSILSVMKLQRVLGMSIPSLRKVSWLPAVALMAIIISGGCAKIVYATTHDVSEFLPYPLVNKEIPGELVAYFESDPTYGRVLALRCPLWIYVLPYYTNKPLIDGWYPQDKLLKRLLEIDDYRILDLESAGPVRPEESPNRTMTWRRLILDSEVLAIGWVIVGAVPEEVRTDLFRGTQFKLDAHFRYEDGMMTVYRSLKPAKMTELDPPDAGEVILKRDGPDRLMLKLSVRGSPTLIIKEAYFPTWRAVSNDTPLNIRKNAEGFMTIVIPLGATEIEVYQKPADPTLYYISVTALVTLLLTVVLVFAQRRVLARRGGE